MPQGLEVYDSAGHLIVSTSSRLTRVISVIEPGIVDGSQSFPAAQNTIAAILSNYTEAQADSGGVGVLPEVSVSGTTVSWTFNGQPSFLRMYTRILVLGY